MVDVRSREDQRIGKYRIDKLAEFFESQMPFKSKNYDELYSKVWRAEDYPMVVSQEEATKEEMKETKEEKNKKRPCECAK